MVRNTDNNKRNRLSTPGTSRREESDMNNRKRNLTLDFQAKKPKMELLKDSPPVLCSPDISKFKMKSPDVEKFLSHHLTGGATPTPTLLYPKNVTEAQEIYAKGFEDALHQLQCSDSSQGAYALDLNSNSSSSMTYTDLDPSRGSTYMSPLDIVIKDEPQTVPCLTDSPRVSPIDMESQEVQKLERKRQRNRVAASKCRQRKLERISKLEDKVKNLKNENTELTTFLMRLKTEVCNLKGRVMEHVNSGCQIMHTA